jgi:hypothetical protein
VHRYAREASAYPTTFLLYFQTRRWQWRSRLHPSTLLRSLLLPPSLNRRLMQHSGSHPRPFLTNATGPNFSIPCHYQFDASSSYIPSPLACLVCNLSFLPGSTSVLLPVCLSTAPLYHMLLHQVCTMQPGDVGSLRLAGIIIRCCFLTCKLLMQLWWESSLCLEKTFCMSSFLSKDPVLARVEIEF